MDLYAIYSILNLLATLLITVQNSATTDIQRQQAIGVATDVVQTVQQTVNSNYASGLTLQISAAQKVIADWKTYRNDKYGIEFKYPNTWTIADKSQYDTSAYVDILNFKTKQGYFLGFFDIQSVEPLSLGSTIEQFKKRYSEYPSTALDMPIGGESGIEGKVSGWLGCVHGNNFAESCLTYDYLSPELSKRGLMLSVEIPHQDNVTFLAGGIYVADISVVDDITPIHQLLSTVKFYPKS